MNILLKPEGSAIFERTDITTAVWKRIEVIEAGVFNICQPESLPIGIAGQHWYYF